MKKALGIFLALSLATGVFAVEPVADLNLADFTGWAEVGFGVNLDTGKTGFENETGVTLEINFLTESDKSTTGSGIWGEIVVLLDGDMNILIDDETSGSTAGFEFDELIIDVATLHIYDFYVGVVQGAFDYGGDFLYPNALNYDSDDSVSISTITSGGPVNIPVDLIDDALRGFSTYDQGIVLGYANDLFSAEVNLNSKSVADFDAPVVSTANVSGVVTSGHITIGANGLPTGESVFSVLPPLANNRRYAAGVTIGEAATAGEVIPDPRPDAPDGQYIGWGHIVIQTFDPDDSIFFTDNYAIGTYVELTPITDLVVGVGFATIISDSENKATEGNYGLFGGLSYILPITDVYKLQPVVTYRQEGNFDVDDPFHSHLGMGLRFGWGEEVEETSLLVDFFENDLFYESEEDDENLLPGISLFTTLHLEYDDILDHYLPVLITVYTGEIVPNLKLYGTFFLNIAAADGEVASTISEPLLEGSLASGLQAGLAGSYAIAVGDVTITPALGFLLRAANLKSTIANDPNPEGEALAVKVELAVGIEGLVPNTTFTLAWEEAEFINYNVSGSGSNKVDKDDNVLGELKCSVKIAL